MANTKHRRRYKNVPPAIDDGIRRYDIGLTDVLPRRDMTFQPHKLMTWMKHVIAVTRALEKALCRDKDRRLDKNTIDQAFVTVG